MKLPDEESLSDQELSGVAEEIAGKLQTGDRVDSSDYRRRYPHLAERIDELIPKMRLLDQQESPSAVTTLAKHSEGSSQSPPLPLDQRTVRLGDFEIECEIGRGGMGVVYRARQLTLDRQVALKVLPFAAVVNERQLARFKVEAQAAAGLHHPGIVPVYSVGCDDGVHYYAMQYIDGTSLGVILSGLRKRQPPPTSVDTSVDENDSEKSASTDSPSFRLGSTGSTQVDFSSDRQQHFRAMAELGIQAAEALEHAHQSGVIHRDIKPGNLLIDQDGKLWITDFGLARIEHDSELTATGDLVGTLRYMSPEQALSPRTATDPRCDIYSLGATLYEMLTLRRPFEGEDRQAILEQIQNRDPMSPCKINERIPDELETIVLKALEKDPSSRYQSAEAFAEDLRCYLQDRPISARRPSVYARARKWVRRHPASVNSAIAMLILVAIVSAISSVLLGREQQETQDALMVAKRNYEKSEENRRIAEAANSRSEQLLYVRGLGLAARAWQDGDGSGAKTLLRSNPAYEERTELRDFGWRVVENALSGQHHTVQQQDSEVLATAWSGDDRFFATSDGIGVIRIWDAQTDQCVATIDEHDQPVFGLAFHPDSNVIASVSGDGSLRTWSVPDGAPLEYVPDAHRGETVFAVVYSHDGTRIATGGADTNARLWSAGSLNELDVLDAHRRDVRAVAFSPNDLVIATGGNDRTVHLWDAQTAEHRRALLGHNGMVLCVAFSRSGKFLISGSNDHTIRFWDVESGDVSAEIDEHLDGIQSIAVLPDGKRIIVADRGGQMRVWKISGKTIIDRFDEASVDGFHAVRLAPSGRYWAGVTAKGRLLVHDLSTQRTEEVQRGIANKFPVAHKERLAFSPSGNHLYCSDRILMLSGADGTKWGPILKLDVLPGSPGHFSPDSKLLATGAGRTIRLWNADDGSLHRELEAPAKSVIGVRFSPDGRHLAAWFLDDWKIAIWDLERREIVAEIDSPGGYVFDLEYASDGQRFVTCNKQGQVRIWDALGENSEVVEGIEGRAETVAWLHQDQAVAIGIPGRETTIHWLDGSDAVETIGENQIIRDLGIHPEQELAIEQDYHYGVAVRDLQRLDVRSRRSDFLQGHDDRIWSVSVSATGDSILSSSRDGSTKRWTTPDDSWNWLTRRPHNDYLADDLHWVRGRIGDQPTDDLRLIVAQKLRCSVYQWPAGTLVHETQWRKRRGNDPVGNAFEAVAADPQGRWVALGHRDGTIRIWDPSLSGPKKTLSGFNSDAGVWAMEVSSDGRFLAACSHTQKAIKIWNTSDWTEHWSDYADDCDDFAFSRDGKRLIYCDGRAAVIIDVQAGKRLLRLPEHTITVHGVAFSGDGRFVATACEDRKIRIWDAQSSRLIKTFSGHVDSASRVTFSPDDSILVSGDSEGSIRLWHLGSHQELFELAKLDSEIQRLTFDPRGDLLIAITEDGRVHVFDGRATD